jgi:hypothetical protein
MLVSDQDNRNAVVNIEETNKLEAHHSHIQ